jgi:uncharacterized protein (TIGR02145 family)
MKRLVALMICAVSIGMMPNSLSAQDTTPCSGIELMQNDLVVTCDDAVWLQSLTGPLLWNQDLFSDSLLVSSSGIVEVQEAALDLSFVDLGEELSYLNLGDGFNNLTFPVTIAARFSIPEGHDSFHLFATDEGLGYSGISLTLSQSLGWFETFIGDGYGGGPSQRRSKRSYCSLLTDTWYTVVAVIRGATDHSVYLDGQELAGDYDGSGNGQIVDLGRPATMGYHIPDSGPQYGQELSYPMKFDFLGVYDFELQSSDIINAGSCDSDSSGALVRPSGAIGWYDFNGDEPFADTEGNQPPIQAVGDVQSDVTYCLCPAVEQVEVQLLDCEYAEFFCGEGTTWDDASQSCIVANPSDSNFDGCVQLNDLLDLLSAYGDCGAEESAWQCGDPLEYQGYDYETVQIGEQCWFAENCRYLPYLNEVGNGSDTEPRYYILYENHTDLLQAQESLTYLEYGALYNLPAVLVGEALCPSGWHIPNIQEWEELGAFAAQLGPNSLKDESWDGGGSGFDAKAAGHRADYGDYIREFEESDFWSVTIEPNCVNHVARLMTNEVDLMTNDLMLHCDSGNSVRCIKDAE